MDIHHIQFNVVDAETLRTAKAHPEQHRDLIDRLAGYSDYFCDLTEALHDKIIARIEQQAPWSAQTGYFCCRTSFV